MRRLYNYVDMRMTRRMDAIFSSGTTVATRRWPRLAMLAALGIVVVALALRLYGVNWDAGFSWTPHPDERAILTQVERISPPSPGNLDSLFDADESPWNPRWFPYGSFPLYLLKGVQLVYSELPGLEMRDLRLAGRTISALADVGTVLLVLWLGSRLYGRRTGLLASAFTALAVIHIQLSHFYTVDTLLTLFAVAAVFFMYRVAIEGRLRDSALAGAFIGLGLATKASLAPIYVPFIGAHLIYLFAMSGRQGPATPFADRTRVAVKGLLAGAATSVLVVFITEPYAFLDWSRFSADFTEQSEMVRRIRDYPYTRQYIDTTPYWYHIRQLATWGLGWPLGAVAWAGLLYASLRGMRLRMGLAYLVVGWAVPAALLLFSTDVKMILPASGIAFAALLATLPVRSAESRLDVLLLSWVVPYFLITGALQVKFLRYMMPITPFLLLFGSQMLVSAWDETKRRLPSARPWAIAGLVLLLGATGFYALSYMSIYRESHTAVRASEWIRDNAPKGSVVLKEHWEESVPGLNDYRVRELPMYDRDDPNKFRLIAKDLEEADYLVLFSNRLYGTLPRIPERYPTSAAYYDLLFTGALGYELVDLQTSYPDLLGVSFVDDTFRRPGVSKPDVLDASGPSGMTLGLGFADESFTVYDHPKVMVLENRARYDADTIQRAIEEAGPYPVNGESSVAPRTVGLMLSPEAAEAQRRGGSWSDIVRDGSWTNRLPILALLIVVEGIALLALPIGFLLFRPLPDRGYLFSKVLGLLLVALVVWLFASLRWMQFSFASILVALLPLGAVSAGLLLRWRREMVAFVKERWPILLIGELVFLAAFFAFVVVRMANPDLWHPFRGGEKPMDLAYLNAVLRSSYMPPYDPWFSGGFLNYYYWGQFIVAMLVRATGINPDVAYNLAVPLMFALTVAGGFSLVYCLAEATRRRLAGPGSSRERFTLSWSPVWAGMAGGLFVTVLGNLDGAVQVGHGIWRALARNLPFGEFDFWRSSRMMPPDPPGHEITEFPFFTFLFADLHAHLVAIPFTLLVLGLALSVILGATRWRSRRGDVRAEGSWSFGEIARLAMLGVAVGSLRLINAWDYPTYLIVAVFAVFLAGYYRHGGLALRPLFDSGVKAFFVVAVSFLAFLPFHLTNETFVDGLESTTNRTVLWQFLAIHGLFIFIIGSFFAREAAGWIASPVRDGLSLLGRRASSVIKGTGRVGGDGVRISPGGALVLAAVLSLTVYVILAAVSGATGSTIPFVTALLVVVLAVALRWALSSRPDGPILTFVAGMIMVSLALVIGLDIYRVENDIARMNSVFKFYLQVWVLLALASAYLLWRLGHGIRIPLWKLGLDKKVWLGALAALMVSASIYPIMGAQDRLRDRFNGQVIPMTLDGTAYAQGAVYHDRNGDIDLAADFEGIAWLRENVEGSPVVLEGNTPTYRWGGRVSIYTGLPSVVGWRWHQEQQRWDYRWAVSSRIQDVARIYGSTDAEEALALLRKYGVEYVYVGQVERLYYPGDGLSKFDGALSEYLDKVFENERTAIYRVRDG